MSGTRASSTTGDSLTGGVAAPGFDDFEMRLGDMMRGERATIGKSLLDVQRELRIRACVWCFSRSAWSALRCATEAAAPAAITGGSEVVKMKPGA